MKQVPIPEVLNPKSDFWEGLTLKTAVGPERLRLMADQHALSEKNTWTPKDFRDSLTLAARLKDYQTRLPRSIDLSGMAPTIQNYARLTLNDGKERGKIGFIDLTERRLIMGMTSLGDERHVNIERKVPVEHLLRPLSPVLMLHTHPTRYWTRRVNLHFSEQDVKSLLECPDMQGSLVITADEALLLMKTKATPRESKAAELDSHLQNIAQRARSHSSSGEGARILTKMAAREFGLVLYYMKHSRDCIAREVWLTKET